MSPSPPIGAHVSTAGGLHNCFANGEKIGAECLQIFGASPRQWKATLPSPEALETYHKERIRSGLKPIYLHAAYLVNLGTPDQELYEKSIHNLATHLQIAELLKAEGLVFHIGSYKGTSEENSYDRVAEGMQKVLELSPGTAHLIMENCAGGGCRLGTNTAQIGEIFRRASDPRIKVCIDTAHAFASGTLCTFSSEELDQLAHDCDTHFGLENLTVLHINDSKVAHNTGIDRHENLGKGHIGHAAFKNLKHHPVFGRRPWILEVPGFDNQGPDIENITTAKNL